MREPDECPNCHYGQCEIVKLSEIPPSPGFRYAVVCYACNLRGPTGETEEEGIQAWSDLPRRSSKREPIEVVHSFAFNGVALSDLILRFYRRLYRLKKEMGQ